MSALATKTQSLETSTFQMARLFIVRKNIMMPTMTAMMKTMTKIWTFWQILMLALLPKE